MRGTGEVLPRINPEFTVHTPQWKSSGQRNSFYYLKILKNGTQKTKENTKSDDTKIIVLTQTRVCNKVLFSDQKDYPAIDRSVYSNV